MTQTQSQSRSKSIFSIKSIQIIYFCSVGNKMDETYDYDE